MKLSERYRLRREKRLAKNEFDDEPEEKEEDDTRPPCISANDFIRMMDGTYGKRNIKASKKGPWPVLAVTFIIITLTCAILALIYMGRWSSPFIKVFSILYAVGWTMTVIALITSLADYDSDVDSVGSSVLVWLLLFVTGPFLIIPAFFIVRIDDIKDKRGTRYRKDQKMQEASRIKQSVDHIKQVYSQDRKTADTYAATYHSLKKTTKEEEYGKILSCLSKIHLPSPYTMYIEFHQSRGIGDESKLYVKDNFGIKHFDIFNYVNVEVSPEGAWQAYMLSEVWRLLPLWWHALYGVRTLLFTKDEFIAFAKQKHLPDSDIEEVVSKIDESPVALDPFVTEEDGHYTVSCCFWNDWKGLCREYVDVTITDDKATVGKAFSTEVLYKYHCGYVY